MGVRFDFDTATAIGLVDGLLMDVARRLQVPPSRHEEAIEHYLGLSAHVDRAGSPLENRVLEIYPSGSFAIHCATYSRVKSGSHDVDAVLEVDVPLNTDPEWMLDKLFDAVKGEPGSKYHDYKIERNTRCITIAYPDGVTVDLMPIVRIPNGPERSGWLFHHQTETDEKAKKEVNPKAFANHFNENIGSSDSFAVKFQTRRLLLEGTLAEKAETQPMPVLLPLEEKSPRLIAIQLLKRFTQVKYRASSRKALRRPPSVMIAALALEAGPMSDNLAEEVRTVASYICEKMAAADWAGETIRVVNPAHPADEFTDRWPEDIIAQRLWQTDLEQLISALDQLAANEFDPGRVQRLLATLFGETLAEYALEEHFRGQGELAKSNRLGVTTFGVLRSAGAASAASSLILPARASTNMGGSIVDIDY